MHESIINRNKALNTTISILENSMSDINSDKFLSNFEKKLFRDIIINKIAHLWFNENDILSIGDKILQLKQYTNTNALFSFKVIECTNYIRNIINPTTQPIFFLN